MWADLLNNVLYPVLAALLTGIIGIAATRFYSASGIKIDQKYQDDLHRALMTGVKSAIEKLGHSAQTKDIVQYAVEYADKSVPEAMKALNPSPQVLSDLANAKVAEVKKDT